MIAIQELLQQALILNTTYDEHYSTFDYSDEELQKILERYI